MVKVSDLKSTSQIAEEEIANPAIRREVERMALANAVAIELGLMSYQWRFPREAEDGTTCQAWHRLMPAG